MESFIDFRGIPKNIIKPLKNKSVSNYSDYSIKK